RRACAGRREEVRGDGALPPQVPAVRTARIHLGQERAARRKNLSEDRRDRSVLSRALPDLGAESDSRAGDSRASAACRQGTAAPLLLLHAIEIGPADVRALLE